MFVFSKENRDILKIAQNEFIYLGQIFGSPPYKTLAV